MKQKGLIIRSLFDFKEKKLIIGLFTAFLVFISDQFSKQFIMHFLLENGAPFKVNPYFNIVEAFNKGVSFSMFDNGGLLGCIMLILLALGVVGFLLWWLKDEPSRFVQICLGFIIGGALGNVYDRLSIGAVYDFLDFHIKAYHWPAFNVADSFICIGAFLIICHTILNRKKISLKEITK